MEESKFIETDNLNEYFTRGYEFAEIDLKQKGQYAPDDGVITGSLHLAYLVWPDDRDTFKPHIRMFVQIFRDGYRAHKSLKISKELKIENLMNVSVETAKVFNSIAREDGLISEDE
jgi:hypothetical protein